MRFFFKFSFTITKNSFHFFSECSKKCQIHCKSSAQKTGCSFRPQQPTYIQVPTRSIWQPNQGLQSWQPNQGQQSWQPNQRQQSYQPEYQNRQPTIEEINRMSRAQLLNFLSTLDNIHSEPPGAPQRVRTFEAPTDFGPNPYFSSTPCAKKRSNTDHTYGANNNSTRPPPASPTPQPQPWNAPTTRQRFGPNFENRSKF